MTASTPHDEVAVALRRAQTAVIVPAVDPSPEPQPVLDGQRPRGQCALVYVFTLVPTLALAAAVPLAWGWGLSWLDVGLAVGFYLLSGLGRDGRLPPLLHPPRVQGRTAALRNALAIAGSMAVQGDVITWVADHRRHHAFADKEGDPHSPVAVRHQPGRAGQGLLPRPPGLAVRPGPHQRRPLHPRPARRPRHRPDQPAVPAVDRGQPARPGPARRADHDVVVGRVHGVLLGRAGPGRPCCTTSPGRSTRSAT